MKPRVKLLGTDGNVFSIIATVKVAARKAGWTKERIDALVRELMSQPSYGAVLRRVMEQFDVR